MDSDLADAKEIKAAEESAWEILTGFSLPKYAVDSLTHYKNNPESFKNEVLSGITVAVMQVPESSRSRLWRACRRWWLWKSKFYGEFAESSRRSDRSTRRLLDGVAMPIPRPSTEPARPRRRRDMTC